MIKEFLKLGGVATVDEFYKKYPTEDSFFEVFPQAKRLAERAKGGMAEAFPQSMKADNFFSMGYYAPQQPYLFMHGGSHGGYSEVYPQAIPYPARPGAGKFPTLPLNFKAEGGVAEMYPQSPKYLDKPLGGGFLQNGGEDGSKNDQINNYPTNRRPFLVNWLKNRAGAALSKQLTKDATQYSMDLQNQMFTNGGQPDPNMMDAEGMGAAERARRDYDMKMALNEQGLKDSFNSLFSLGDAMSYHAPFHAKILRAQAKYGGGPLKEYQKNGQVTSDYTTQPLERPEDYYVRAGYINGEPAPYSPVAMADVSTQPLGEDEIPSLGPGFSPELANSIWKYEGDEALQRYIEDVKSKQAIADIMMEFTSAPALQRVSADPMKAVKGVGQTAADLVSLPAGLTIGSVNYLTGDGFDMGTNIIGQNYGEGLYGSLDLASLIPGAALTGSVLSSPLNTIARKTTGLSNRGLDALNRKLIQSQSLLYRPKQGVLTNVPDADRMRHLSELDEAASMMAYMDKPDIDTIYNFAIKSRLSNDELLRIFGKTREEIINAKAAKATQQPVPTIDPGNINTGNINTGVASAAQLPPPPQYINLSNLNINTSAPAYTRRNISNINLTRPASTTYQASPTPHNYSNVQVSTNGSRVATDLSKPELEFNPEQTRKLVRGLFKPKEYSSTTSAAPFLYASDFKNKREMVVHLKKQLENALKSANKGDIVTGSTNTSHNSYLTQMDFIFKNAGKQGLSEPKFLGYKPMNASGFLSGIGNVSNDDILKYINANLNKIQNKTKGKLNLKSQAPYMDEYGTIMIPHYGLEKTTDDFSKIIKRYGGPLKEYQSSTNSGQTGTGGGSSAPPAGSGASNQTGPEYNYYLTDEEKALIENYKKKQAYRQALYEAYNVEQPYGEGLFAYQPLNQRGTKYAYNRPLYTILDPNTYDVFDEKQRADHIINRLLGIAGDVKSRSYRFKQSADDSAPPSGEEQKSEETLQVGDKTYDRSKLSGEDKVKIAMDYNFRPGQFEDKKPPAPYKKPVGPFSESDVYDQGYSFNADVDDNADLQSASVNRGKPKPFAQSLIDRAAALTFPYRSQDKDVLKKKVQSNKNISTNQYDQDYDVQRIPFNNEYIAIPKKGKGGILKQYQGTLNSGQVDGTTIEETYNKTGFNYRGPQAAQFNIAAADTLTGFMERAGYNKERKKLPEKFSGYNVFAKDTEDLGDWYALSGDFKPNMQGFKNQYVQYGGSTYQEGGEYFLTQDDIDQIIAMGGEVEFLD